VLGLIGALLTMLSATSGDGPTAPIYLVTEPAAEGVRVQVLASAASDLEASFVLEVNSDTVSGGNRSSHRGSAKLRSGETATLSTVTLGNVAAGRWEARLRVEPVGQEPYEQIRNSSSR